MLRNRQDEFFEETTPPSQWDYSFVDYYQKAYEFAQHDADKSAAWVILRQAEARRDFYTGMIKEIKRLEQFDSKPNLELTEPKWEIYKITITDYFCSVNSLNSYLPSSNDPGNHRVLFQNANGNINMGVWYDDPVRDVYDVAWFCTLALEMEKASKTKGLISIDKEFNTQSCFVELQRN